MSGGVNFHANVKSDSKAAKEDLMQLAKLQVFQQIFKAGGAELQKQTQRNMTQKYTGHLEGSKMVSPTGATKRSVALHIEQNGLQARVTVGTEYFPYLELGTRFMDARPTLKPAFDQTVGQLQSRIARMKG
ncbi:HK97-gp10 family putative phage morphogenesis protein [Lacticaseibacillus mingshuiensis]|uniref:HK97-gp10 family putative phage morphogenesis protein n=1 Tax=Lacticaseibacillus mingshuiensis TaxID=2799574 RepID=UPI001CECE7ED|nr:HK97-gp10 family putative phage morphogenesis protein [Lacticaseibacillus mingshuiensis]